MMEWRISKAGKRLAIMSRIKIIWECLLSRKSIEEKEHQLELK
jgi:hypothetical protein